MIQKNTIGIKVKWGRVAFNDGTKHKSHHERKYFKKVHHGHEGIEGVGVNTKDEVAACCSFTNQVVLARSETLSGGRWKTVWMVMPPGQ